MFKTGLIILAAMVVPSAASAQITVRLQVPEVRVRVAPPPLRVEVRPERRAPDQIWIEGHWARRANSNVWIPGVWTTPPQDGMVWEQARWTERNGAWFYAEGHWRWANEPTPTTVYVPRAQEAVVVEQAPPPNIAERRPARPFRGAVWIPGFWRWDGSQHDWVAGHWSARQDNRAVWTPDRWQRERVRGEGRGEGRGHGRGQAQWVLVPGHWSHR